MRLSIGSELFWQGSGTIQCDAEQRFLGTNSLWEDDLFIRAGAAKFALPESFKLAAGDAGALPRVCLLACLPLTSVTVSGIGRGREVRLVQVRGAILTLAAEMDWEWKGRR